MFLKNFISVGILKRASHPLRIPQLCERLKVPSEGPVFVFNNNYHRKNMNHPDAIQ